MKSCPEQAVPDDEVVGQVKILRGGRQPETDLMRTLSRIVQDGAIPRSRLIAVLRNLTSYGRILNPDEITVRVKQTLGFS